MGLLGALGIILGAFGAHALNEHLGDSGRLVWETAVKYHLIHAVALLALGAWASAKEGKPGFSPRLLNWAAWCWLAGVACFSGSLYVLALGGPHWLGPVTPLGGLLLITGWVLVAAAGWRK
ncbi:MAG TPA: DUF423 domain-containing protein [Verrucomicrobiae bacterium]|nr:DUF423 domain-containing protein [Verrucomicrobiae bacterium]